MSTASLPDRVRVVLDLARRSYEGRPAALAEIDAATARLDQPLRVAIGGRVKSGKSTVLNALVGIPIAATDAAECTKVVTWYRHGRLYRAVVHPREGEPEPAELRRGTLGSEVALGHWRPEDLARIEVEWPAPILGQMTLIDTPGLGSLDRELDRRSRHFLVPADRASSADAVVYLARHLHAEDVRFLEAFHDDDAGRPDPVNAIGVLARADEVGACRLEAMEVAARVAARYRSDPQVRRLCQTVVPVAGLLAVGAAQLTEAHFSVIGRLAAADDETAEEVLVSSDRFAERQSERIAVAASERQQLLDLLGLYGVRLARHLVRSGVNTAGRLSVELRRRSGIDELRAALATQFAARSDLLKARAALATIEHVLRVHPLADAEELEAAVERVEAGAHELAELRLLLAIRSGGVELGADETSEVECLIESAGTDVATRLGLAGTEPGEVTARVRERVDRWRRRAEYPLAPVAEADAARIVVRSYEGMLLELDH